MSSNYTDSTGLGFSLLNHTHTAQAGTVTLSGGTATVNTPAITANSVVFLTCQSLSGTLGILRISARVPGVSFTITSLSILDTSVVGWLITEP